MFNKRLNLLPLWYVKKKTLKRITKEIAAVSAVIFLFIVLIVTFLEITTRNLEEKRQLIKTELESTKYIESEKMAKDLSELKKMESIAQSEGLVSNISANGESINEKLNKIMVSIEEHVSEYEVSYNAINNETAISGLVQSEDNIKLIQEELSNLKIYKEIRLDVVHKENNKGTRFTFQLNE